MIEEKYTVASSKDEQLNKYYYNSENQLDKMKLAKGEYYMDVDFEYVSEKISRQVVLTNTPYRFGELYIPLSSCNLRDKFNFKYLVDYFYDSKNNLIKLDRYVNDDLKNSVEYVLEYY